MTTARSVAAATATLIAVAYLFIDWSAPLIDQHAFRQTQTALPVYWYLRDGIDLLRPPLPLFGTEAVSIPFEFPLYQALTAAMLDLLGARSVEAVAAGCRAVSLAFHLVAAWPLHRLASRHFSPAAADGAVLLWLGLPYSVFWSTTSMIESMAMALVLLHVDMVDRAATAGRATWLVAASAVLGALAAMVKITTFVIYLPTAGLLYAVARQLWQPSRWSVRDVAVLVFSAGLPMACAFAWTGWADMVKSQNVIGGLGLTSSELADWNFGTLAQRLSITAWKAIALTAGITILGLPGTAAFACGVARTFRDPRRMVWLLPGILGPMVFFNLYVVHDYYAYAILPVLAVFAAWGLAGVVGWLVRTLPAGRLAPNLAPNLAAALAAPALLAAIWADADLRWRPVAQVAAGQPPVYLFRRLMPDAPHWPEATRALEIARFIREGNYPPGPIVVTGNDWMADLALYAERRAFMIGKDRDHAVGGCSERNWQAIRAARPVLFIKLRPSVNECAESVPIHACTIKDTGRYWIGSCMAGS